MQVLRLEASEYCPSKAELDLCRKFSVQAQLSVLSWVIYYGYSRVATGQGVYHSPKKDQGRTFRHETSSPCRVGLSCCVSPGRLFRRGGAVPSFPLFYKSSPQEVSAFGDSTLTQNFFIHGFVVSLSYF